MLRPLAECSFSAHYTARFVVCYLQQEKNDTKDRQKRKKGFGVEASGFSYVTPRTHL